MTGLQWADMASLDVIADPVRLRILRHLGEASRASAGELARVAGVHENTVRGHLQALEAAGLVVAERRAPEGPGRPGVDFRLGDDATLVGADFRGVAELLSTALARLRPEPAQLRATGEDWGRYLLGRPGAFDVRERLPLLLEGLGFHAEVRDGELLLWGCPCPLLSPHQPKLLCELAAGVVAGVLAASGSELRLAGCQHHPDRRRCTMILDRAAAPAA